MMPYLLSTYRSDDRVVIQCETVEKAEETLSRVMEWLRDSQSRHVPSNLRSQLRDLSNRLRDSGRYAADECDLAGASLIDEAIAALPDETECEPDAWMAEDGRVCTADLKRSQKPIMTAGFTIPLYRRAVKSGEEPLTVSKVPQ